MMLSMRGISVLFVLSGFFLFGCKFPEPNFSTVGKSYSKPTRSIKYAELKKQMSQKEIEEMEKKAMKTVYKAFKWDPNLAVYEYHEFFNHIEFANRYGRYSHKRYFNASDPEDCTISIQKPGILGSLVMEYWVVRLIRPKGGYEIEVHVQGSSAAEKLADAFEVLGAKME